MSFIYNNINICDDIDILLPEDFIAYNYKYFNTDLIDMNEEQLKIHYIEKGFYENRIYKISLPEDFIIDNYKYLNNDLQNINDAEYLKYHYINIGFYENRIYKISLPEDFIVDNYKYFNTDLIDMNEEQLKIHYINYGFYENRIYKITLPRDFNPIIYKKINSDLAHMNENELINHYIDYGYYENRIYKIDLPKDLNFTIYKNINYDLKDMNEEELKNHYINYGYFENRIYKIDLPKDFDINNYKIFNKDLNDYDDEYLKYHYVNIGYFEKRFYHISQIKINYIDHILWINLERSIDRCHYMNKLLFNLNINIDNTRIDAIDGNSSDFLNKYSNLDTKLTNFEVACMLSHIKAINYLKNINGEYFMICEDDINFDNLEYFKITLFDIIKNAPEFDILLLYKSFPFELEDEYTDWNKHYDINKNESIISGAVSYIVTKNFVNKFKYYDIDNLPENLSESDRFLFINNKTVVYKYNFISTNTKESTIHNDHISNHILWNNIQNNIIKNNLEIINYKKKNKIFINLKAKEYTINIVNCILSSLLNYEISDNINECNLIISHICDTEKYFYNDNKFKILISGEPFDSLDININLTISSIIHNNSNKHIYYPYLYYSLYEHRLSINNLDYINTKNKFCAYLYNAEHFHRKHYFNLLSKYKKVDALGKCCNNIDIENTRTIYNSDITYNDISIRLYTEYKFVLAIENSFIDGYSTEKLINPLIAGSIPIYWGDDYIFNFINKNRIIYTKDFNTDEDLLNYIKFLDENDIEYNNIVNQSIYIKDNNYIQTKFINELNNFLIESNYLINSELISICKPIVKIKLDTNIKNYFLDYKKYYSMQNLEQFKKYFLPNKYTYYFIDNNYEKYDILINDIQLEDNKNLDNNNINMLISVENMNHWTHYKHYNKYNNYLNDKMHIYIYNHITCVNEEEKYIGIPTIYRNIDYYKFRKDFYKKLNETDFINKKFCLVINKSGLNKEINSFINELNNIDTVDNIDIYNDYILNKSCYNSIELLNVLNKYKFILCIENSYCDGYITEKIFNCFFAKTIPLYKGSPSIEKYFNINRFINLNNQDYIDKIKNIVNNELLYNTIINNDIINNKYYNENYDLKITNFIDKKLYNNNLYKNYFNINFEYNSDTIHNIKNYNVIIGGVCRDVEKYIKKNLEIIDNIGIQFDNYDVVIYENDSIDNTRNILNNNLKNNYYYIFEDNINIKSRIERLAYCRNKVITKINELSKIKQYNYLIILDLDDILYSGVISNTIKTCFGYDVESWDAMFANQTDKYYDIYPLRIKNLIEFNCWEKIHEYLKYKSHEESFYESISKYQIYIPPSYLIDVDSAFGGAGIYKFDKIFNGTYIGKDKKNYEICEHISFNNNIKNNGGKLFINTRMLTN